MAVRIQLLNGSKELFVCDLFFFENHTKALALSLIHISGEAFSDGTPEKEVVNPIPILKRIRRMSLLELIVPADKGISEKEADRASLLSGRSLQKGMDMTEAVKRDQSSDSPVCQCQQRRPDLKCPFL